MGNLTVVEILIAVAPIIVLFIGGSVGYVFISRTRKHAAEEETKTGAEHAGYTSMKKRRLEEERDERRQFEAHEAAEREERKRKALELEEKRRGEQLARQQKEDNRRAKEEEDRERSHSAEYRAVRDKCSLVCRHRYADLMADALSDATQARLADSIRLRGQGSVESVRAALGQHVPTHIAKAAFDTLIGSDLGHDGFMAEGRFICPSKAAIAAIVSKLEKGPVKVAGIANM
ncbi:hypothetical protein J8273_7923 [Carpediemonas membranifera]|uniref:DDRGK domain-containing protein 1 n=1 Tax=Carpediemonas membranifera TaxID=201153 RepID=A0A8J6B0T2_9EUKA|nr:hypothetical protein J8273_7923 [Carpediemonas membranifera]|eukprot:KAG9390572.1 hypothetical protein J8273_7923 [Carpediemonas membranifera]